MPNDPIKTAKQIVKERFPKSVAAFLGGSVARGDFTSTSDLDIVIINHDGPDYRESFYTNGWPVEVFVLTLYTYSLYLELDRQYGLPLYIRILSEGIIIKDTGEAKDIKEHAADLFKNGPDPWPEDKVYTTRYVISDILEDLRGSTNEQEDVFIVNTLVQVLQEFILRTNQQWIGEGKWIIRSLRQFDSMLADTLCEAINSFYKQGDKQQIITFTEKILADSGGELFDGFKGTHLL